MPHSRSILAAEHIDMAAGIARRTQTANGAIVALTFHHHALDWKPRRSMRPMRPLQRAFLAVHLDVNGVDHG